MQDIQTGDLSTVASGPMAGLYDDGELYDRMLESSIGHADVGFYASIAAQTRGKVLELGCGTGRLSVPLCQDGFRVTGLDLSERMLDTARKKAARAGVSARFLQGDFRSFHLGERFDLIMLPHNTLAHMLTPQDAEHCLAAVREHLEDDGLFVIQMSQPHPLQLMHQPGDKFLLIRCSTDSGEQLDVFENAMYDCATQVLDRTWFVESARGLVRQIRFQTRVMFPVELDSLVRMSGFSMRAKYGSYALSDYGRESETQLLVLGKRAAKSS